MLHPKSLKRKILSNPLNKAVFSSGRGVYLVGGYIRNILIHGKHSKDIDYVVKKDIEALVSKVSKGLNGTVIELRKEHILRIALRDGRTLDFSRLTKDIEDDLRERDFTLNAMAWAPESGLIDPVGGISDIEKRLIKGISRENFLNDPLRLLRAYRFSAELSWQIDRKTRRIIKSMPERLKTSASERITLEFFKLLNADEPLNALKAALRDGVLTEIISLSFNKLERNIKLISNINKNLKKLPERYFLKEFSQGLCYMGLLRLEGLLLGSDINKNLFTLSRDILKRVTLVQAHYKEFERVEGLSRGEMFDIFSESEDAVIDLLILTGKTGYLKEAERFFRIKQKGILSSEEIMAVTGLKPGPKLGETINRLKKAQFKGEIRGRLQARNWLINNL
jgi:tRNA nucleotidyltransferase/poly(A) polymerase